MLISHLNKFIYTKTSKTGGTSVEIYFEKYCVDPVLSYLYDNLDIDEYRDEAITKFGIVGFRGTKEDRIKKSPKWYNHMPADLIKNQVSSDIWNSYFKFCVIRNPYTRLISAFFFFNQNKINLLDNNIDKFVPLFHKWINNANELFSDRDKYMINNEFCLDDYIKYENIKQDLERICKKIFVTYEPVRLGNYKSGITPMNIPIECFYNKEISDKVVKFYKFEFDYFKYKPLY